MHDNKEMAVDLVRLRAAGLKGDSFLQPAAAICFRLFYYLYAVYGHQITHPHTQ